MGKPEAKDLALATKFLSGIFRGAKQDVKAAVEVADGDFSRFLVHKLEKKKDMDSVSSERCGLDGLSRVISDSPESTKCSIRGGLIARRAPLCKDVDEHIEMRDKNHTESCKDVHISYIGVAPKHRRQGCATRLLKCAALAMKKAGATRAWLDTRTLDKSHGLYVAAGFVKVGTIEGLYGSGKWGQATVYALDLSKIEEF